VSLRSCVIIPGFNTAGTIGPLVRQIRQLHLDVVVVNDGSTDDTAHDATEAGALVISHLKNQGKGMALRTGFAFALQAGYDAVVTLDSDGQHDPQDIPQLLEAAERPHGAIVIGHRVMDDASMPLLRLWTNRVMSGIVSWLTGQQIPDSQCGFRVIRRRVLETIQLSTRRFDGETELLLAAAHDGWAVTSMPIRTIYTKRHASHIHPLWDGVRFARLVLKHLLDVSPPRRFR